MTHTKAFTILSWSLRGVAAIILLQTLFFKFSGATESVYIFTTVGSAFPWTSWMEPWGRIGSGVVELIAAILLLLPRTVVYGAVISLGVIGGAIVFHFTVLGIALPAVDDHGELFALALAVFICSAAVLVMHRNELPFLGLFSPCPLENESYGAALYRPRPSRAGCWHS